MKYIVFKLALIFFLMFFIPLNLYSAPYKQGLYGIINIPDAQTELDGEFTYSIWSEYLQQSPDHTIDVSPVTATLGIGNSTELMVGADVYNKFQRLYEKNNIGMITGVKWIYLKKTVMGLDVGSALIGDNLTGYPSIEIREVVERTLNKFNIVFNTGYMSMLKAFIVSAGMIYKIKAQWDLLFDTDNWFINGSGFKNRLDGTAGVRYYFADRTCVISIGMGFGQLYTGKADIHAIGGIAINSSPEQKGVTELKQSEAVPEKPKEEKPQRIYKSPVPEFKMRIPVQPIRGYGNEE